MELYGSIGTKYIKIYLFSYSYLCVYIYDVHFVCLFAPWTQFVNWACNKKSSRVSYVLCTFRLRAVSRADKYI